MVSDQFYSGKEMKHLKKPVLSHHLNERDEHFELVEGNTLTSLNLFGKYFF